MDEDDIPTTTQDAVDVLLAALESRLLELSQRPLRADQRDRLAILLYEGFLNAIHRSPTIDARIRANQRRGVGSMRDVRQPSRPARGTPRSGSAARPGDA